jgi:hypothetical protein
MFALRMTRPPHLEFDLDEPVKVLRRTRDRLVAEPPDGREIAAALGRFQQ